MWRLMCLTVDKSLNTVYPTGVKSVAFRSMRYTPHRGGSHQAASGQTPEAAPDRPGKSARLNLSADTVDSRWKGRYSFWRVLCSCTQYSSRGVPLEFPCSFLSLGSGLHGTTGLKRAGPIPPNRGLLLQPQRHPQRLDFLPQTAQFLVPRPSASGKGRQARPYRFPGNPRNEEQGRSSWVWKAAFQSIGLPGVMLAGQP
jgi:hypothetical protein